MGAPCPGSFYQAGVCPIPADPKHSQARRDLDLRGQLEDFGWIVLSFHHGDDWEARLRSQPGTFGHAPAPSPPLAPPSTTPATPIADSPLDLDLFATEWHPLLRCLFAERELQLAELGDVRAASGRVVGSALVMLSRDGHSLALIDARDPSGAAVRAALEAASGRALEVSPNTPVAEIIAALGA